jgi:hypothetical protein
MRREHRKMARVQVVYLADANSRQIGMAGPSRQANTNRRSEKVLRGTFVNPAAPGISQLAGSLILLRKLLFFSEKYIYEVQILKNTIGSDFRRFSA